MSKKSKALNSLSIEEMKTKGAELEGQLFKLRMQQATGQLANTALIRMTRKEIARLKTFQSQKSKASAAQAKK